MLPSPSLRLAGIVHHLLRVVAALAGGGIHPVRMAPPLILLIHHRLLRLVRRFATIAARVEAGTLRPPLHRRAPSTPAERLPAPRWPERLRGTHAWLVRLAIETAPFGTQLEALLAAPEARALLAAAPQLRSLLRPLCRMLGTPLPPQAPPDPVPPTDPPPPPRALWWRPAALTIPGFRKIPRFRKNADVHAPFGTTYSFR